MDFPSTARNDPDFDSGTGAYWRGGVWLPTVYMGVKGLENYGYGARADEAAEKILEQQYQIYKTYAPHTIWEAVQSDGNYILKVTGVSMNVTSGVQSFNLNGEAIAVPSELPFAPTPVSPLPANIALNKTAAAISSQNSDYSPEKGNDGDGSSMWIASDGNPGNLWMVDLGKSYHLIGSEIVFENEGDVWQYRIEASADGEVWSTLADHTDNESGSAKQSDTFETATRYVRVTITGVRLPDGAPLLKFGFGEKNPL